MLRPVGMVQAGEEEKHDRVFDSCMVFMSIIQTTSLSPLPVLDRNNQICCSLFSIAAGGSLGPEAPLVAVSASASGYISMRYFKHDIVMVRKCTIIGMSAGLSAFFGVQLGGE